MIPLEPEPEEPDEILERCCFCREKTNYWTNLANRKPGAQVACCESCGAHADPIDIPTKRQWIRSESIVAAGQTRMGPNGPITGPSPYAGWGQKNGGMPTDE